MFRNVPNGAARNVCGTRSERTRFGVPDNSASSNYQIISKVYLKKHSTLPLCYSLSAADKKMVTSTMKKMVGPEAE